MANRYEPPKQKGIGQFVDSVFLLVLVYLSLLAPLLLAGKPAHQPPPAQEQAQAAAPTWENLQQNEVQAAQWQKLGYTPETAKPIIEDRFDYTIKPFDLILTIVVILGYFLFLFRWSNREYKEVIAERFSGQ
jgi:hypothetical protein